MNLSTVPEQALATYTLASDVTGTTLTSVVAALGANVRFYATSIKVTNSHATQVAVVKIYNGTTLVERLTAAAAGGGWVSSDGYPYRGELDTAWSIQSESSAAIQCVIKGFKWIEPS